MFEIPEKIEYIIEKLVQNGHKAYIVGGSVRDILLGKIPEDFDITTSATPDEVISIFERTIPTGIKHGTVTVVIDETPVEVTTFRTENGYADNRRPDNVKFVTDVRDDLSRRDFTINAMAYNSQEGLIDCFGGVEDLKQTTIRTVGDAAVRFQEDALRIMRLFRFAATLEFSIEENTLSAALEHAYLLENVSRERIFTELKKAIMSNNFQVFSDLIICGGLEFLNIKKLPNFEKIKKHKDNPLICLYLSIDSKSLDRLKPSNTEREFFKNFDKLSSLCTPKSKVDIKEMLNISTPEWVLDFFRYKEWDTADLKQILKDGEPYKISDLDINGQDLISLGFKGKKIGDILEHLRKIVVNDPQKNKKEILLKEIP